MTEALRLWVSEQFKGNQPLPHWRASALDSSAAEFWLRAFIAEVEKRELDPSSDSFAETFFDLKRELLG